MAATVPGGLATGIGSMPGTDPKQALGAVLEALGDDPGEALPYLPELPARGPGADMVGRAVAMLVDLHCDVAVGGWRLVDRAGVDERRATAYLTHDLDTVDELLHDWPGHLKIQVTGPWTLAALLDLPRGDKVLGDPGAVRDVTASLTEGLQSHVDAVRRAAPSATVVVQLDEPMLPAVLAGVVPTASGLRRHAPVDEAAARAALRAVVDGMAARGAPVVVHCCAADAPVADLVAAGAAGVALDLTLAADDATVLDALAAAVDGGTRLVAGTPASDARDSVASLRTTWRRLGRAADRLAGDVVVSPPCGLAGATEQQAAGSLAAAREVLRRLRDES